MSPKIEYEPRLKNHYCKFHFVLPVMSKMHEIGGKDTKIQENMNQSLNYELSQ